MQPQKKHAVNRFALYLLSSFLSSVLEESIFLGATWLFSGVLFGIAMDVLPAFLARLLSCFVHFFLNRSMVFRDKGSPWKPLGRFLLSSIPLAVLQIVLSSAIYQFLDIPESDSILRGILYAGVMTALFFAGFLIQNYWVFGQSKNAS